MKYILAFNIPGTGSEGLGLLCSMLILIMDEVKLPIAPSLTDEEGKSLSPGLPGPAKH